jgi:prefoldin subunit 5
MARRLGELEAEVDRLRIQVGEVEGQLHALERAREKVERVASLLDGFDVVWNVLTPTDRQELLHLLVARVVVDLGAGGFSIEFHELPAPGAPEEPTDGPPTAAVSAAEERSAL